MAAAGAQGQLVGVFGLPQEAIKLITEFSEEVLFLVKDPSERVRLAVACFRSNLGVLRAVRAAACVHSMPLRQRCAAASWAADHLEKRGALRVQHARLERTPALTVESVARAFAVRPQEIVENVGALELFVASVAACQPESVDEYGAPLDDLVSPAARSLRDAPRNSVSAGVAERIWWALACAVARAEASSDMSAAQAHTAQWRLAQCWGAGKKHRLCNKIEYFGELASWALLPPPEGQRSSCLAVLRVALRYDLLSPRHLSEPAGSNPSSRAVLFGDLLSLYSGYHNARYCHFFDWLALEYRLLDIAASSLFESQDASGQSQFWRSLRSLRPRCDNGAVTGRGKLFRAAFAAATSPAVWPASAEACLGAWDLGVEPLDLLRWAGDATWAETLRLALLRDGWPQHVATALWQTIRADAGGSNCGRGAASARFRLAPLLAAALAAPGRNASRAPRASRKPPPPSARVLVKQWTELDVERAEVRLAELLRSELQVGLPEERAQLAAALPAARAVATPCVQAALQAAVQADEVKPADERFERQTQSADSKSRRANKRAWLQEALDLEERGLQRAEQPTGPLRDRAGPTTTSLVPTSAESMGTYTKRPTKPVFAASPTKPAAAGLDAGPGPEPIRKSIIKRAAKRTGAPKRTIKRGDDRVEQAERAKRAKQAKQAKQAQVRRTVAGMFELWADETGLSNTHLRQACRDLGLSANGARARLLARLGQTPKLAVQKLREAVVAPLLQSFQNIERRLAADA